MLTINLPLISKTVLPLMIDIDMESWSGTSARTGKHTSGLTVRLSVDKAREILGQMTKLELSEENRAQFVSMASARRVFVETRRMIEAAIQKWEADRPIPCWRCKTLAFPHTRCQCGADVLPPIKD